MKSELSMHMGEFKHVLFSRVSEDYERLKSTCIAVADRVAVVVTQMKEFTALVNKTSSKCCKQEVRGPLF